MAQISQGTVCWSLDYSGVVVGTTTDSQVKRLLGDGIFRKNEGDTGGRYFIDAKATATLHTVSYTDRIVGKVIISKGITDEIGEEEQKQATSKWFDPREGFGNYHELRLGVSSKEDVLQNLGKPAKEISSSVWKYFSNCSCQLPKFFTLHFANERLTKIVLSAPPG